MACTAHRCAHDPSELAAHQPDEEYGDGIYYQGYPAKTHTTMVPNGAGLSRRCESEGEAAMMHQVVRRVLILCTGNSARSQMAEAIINTRRAGQWLAFSAGTQPAKRVHPLAIRALEAIGIAHHEGLPKPIEQFIGQPFDLVITVCDDAAESCPMWGGQGERVHLGFPDPAAVTGSEAEQYAAFERVRDAIAERLLAALDERSAHDARTVSGGSGSSE
jgi:arsenate reductase